VQVTEIKATISETKTETPAIKIQESTSIKAEGTTALPIEKNQIQQSTIGKVSALSLKSISLKKELAENQKTISKDTVHLPSEQFTETEMLEQWYKYAQRLNDKGHLIMESLLSISDPKLEGTTIIHELPNEGSKIEFEREMHDLLGYLRGKLHNHDIKISVKVNEEIESKKAFTTQDKFNRLNEINPNLELLKKTFDLDF
jgi:hypothetical protein